MFIHNNILIIIAASRNHTLPTSTELLVPSSCEDGTNLHAGASFVPTIAASTCSKIACHRVCRLFCYSARRGCTTLSLSKVFMDNARKMSSHRVDVVTSCWLLWCRWVVPPVSAEDRGGSIHVATGGDINEEEVRYCHGVSTVMVVACGSSVFFFFLDKVHTVEREGILEGSRHN